MNANKFCVKEIVDSGAMDNISDEIRLLGCECRSLLFKMRRFPWITGRRKKLLHSLDLASSELIGLSNSIHQQDYDVVNKRRKKISALLKIDA